MAFPDRIERTIEITRPLAAVWAALTTAEGLGTWFGNSASIDRARAERPGSPGAPATRPTCGSSGSRSPRSSASPGHIHGLPDDDPRRTYVEFTLEPVGAGTRLTVESGFAQLPDDAHRTAYNGNTTGWASELGDLVAYLDAA